MTMTIFNFALIKGLRHPMTLVLNCIAPIVMIFIRPLWESDQMLSGFGLLVFLIWGGSFLIAQGILNDKETGAITRIMAGPITMMNYLMQNLFAYMVPLTVQILLITVLGTILYGWSGTLAIGIFLVYFVFTIASVAMSFAWNCLFKTKSGSFSSFSGVITFGIALSGALIPLSFFPTALQYIGGIFPAYWAMRAINSLVALESFTNAYGIGILVMVGMTILFLIFGGKRRMI